FNIVALQAIAHDEQTCFREFFLNQCEGAHDAGHVVNGIEVSVRQKTRAQGGAAAKMKIVQLDVIEDCASLQSMLRENVNEPARGDDHGISAPYSWNCCPTPLAQMLNGLACVIVEHDSFAKQFADENGRHRGKYEARVGCGRD